MTLQEFINRKQEELTQSGKYKEVKFVKAIDVGLEKNGTSENFLSVDSDLSRQVEEVVNFSTLPERSIVDSNDNGSKIVFDVKKPRKRKFDNVKFYALYI